MPVILVDDESTDGTADVARHASEKAAKADALIVVQSKPLPAGWTGKLWSMQQGIERARALHPAWLMLADADVLHGPETVADLGLIASHGPYDLVSFMVKLHCESLPEKLLIPAFVYFFFMLYPPAWIRNTRRSTAGAAGGCMLVRAETLERAGGLESIRGAVIDDCSLARLLKQHGGKLWLGLTDQSQSLRRYETFSDVEHMVSRTAFNQLNHSSLLLAGTIAGMLITYLAPPLLLFTQQAGDLYGRCGLGGHDDHVLDDGALLSTESRIGIDPAAGGPVLSGCDNTFCDQILEWKWRRVERKSPGRSRPTQY
jgi:hopene-associated glycosyltransferase HpnB